MLAFLLIFIVLPGVGPGFNDHYRRERTISSEAAMDTRWCASCCVRRHGHCVVGLVGRCKACRQANGTACCFPQFEASFGPRDRNAAGRL